MITVSISELKARLSAFLDIVRVGDEVLVTDRGRPIARSMPAQQSEQEEGRRVLQLAAALEWSGTASGTFITYDDRLRDPASREGFATP